MMRCSGLWHRVAHVVVLGLALACSGETLEVDDTNAPEGSSDDERLRSAESDRRDDDEHAAPLPIEPRGTTIRVVNRTDGMRSRYSPCTGSYTIGIRPAAVEPLLRPPTCSKVECASLNAGEVVTPESECSAAACAPARVDLAPGMADVDYPWDGVYLELTERNCYVPTRLEPGTPMLARVCFGVPAAGDYDVLDHSCEDYPFAYGTSVLEVELQ